MTDSIVIEDTAAHIAIDDGSTASCQQEEDPVLNNVEPRKTGCSLSLEK